MFASKHTAIPIALTAIFAIWPGRAQDLGTLRVTVVLRDAARVPRPIARHALLVSDNPATSAPRRILTGPDGAAEIRLRPGNYTVESDEPVAFEGKRYHWTQTVDIDAGGDRILELSADNAEIEPAGPAASVASEATPVESDPSLLLSQWRDSVAAVWTAGARASGFLVDAAGLVVTSQRALGSAPAVDVQLTPAVKVAARVLVADRARDVAVLWIDRATAAAMRPVPLACSEAANAALANGQRILSIGAPLRGDKELARGMVFRVEPRAVIADFRLAPGSVGGPVFSTAGAVIGLSSLVDDEDERRQRDARVVPLTDVCAAVMSAEKAMQPAPRPSAARLAVEPPRPFPADALEAAVKRGEGSAGGIQMSSSNFDIAWLTPPSVYSRVHDARPVRQGLPLDFGRWSDYFAGAPAVLTVRVTPKFSERVWTTIARGAAYTQGMALPPIKHFKPGFARLRAYCGDAEIAAIHSFILEQRVSESDAIREGLYVFDPSALGPHCKSVRLLLYSEKNPAKPDSRTVEPQVVDRIWQAFAPYRGSAAVR